MLLVKEIMAGYATRGDILKRISVEVNPSEIVALIGANGSGKTTLLMAISGVVKIRKGEILFNGKQIINLPSHEIARLGIGHIPEQRNLFLEMTVYENLYLGAYCQKDKKQIRKTLEEVFELFPRLRERYNQRAGTLSGGEQQMLTIGRALMNRPKLLLLDEPTSGLSPKLGQELKLFILHAKEEGLGVLLAEQNAQMALSVSDRGYVLALGNVVLQGMTSTLIDREEVKKAYLGG